MAVGLLCMMMAAMVFLAGVAGAILLICMLGGRRLIGVGALLTLVCLLSMGIYLFRSEVNNVRARRAALEAEQRAVADRVRAEIEARLGGDALDEPTESPPDNVTLELRWHADKLHDLASSPGAIADAVTSILASVDDVANDKADLAGVPLKNLLDLQVSIDDEHKVPLREIAQVGRRRVVGVERPEDTIHIRLEGVEPDKMVSVLDQASSLIERAVASADDPLRSLVNIDRDEDDNGFAIRIPAREIRQVAANLMLPAHLDAPPVKVARATVKTDEAKPAEVQPLAAEDPFQPEVATPPMTPALLVAQAEKIAPLANATNGERPDWVDQGEMRLPNGIYRMTAKSGPFSSTEECFTEAPGMVHGMVTRYVGRLFGREAQDQLKVPGGWIESVLVKDQWIGEIESETLGTTMYEMHVLVEFDDVARRELASLWQKERLDHRLAMTGTASGLVLLLLGTTFGYLKLDTATRGFYSGRLKLAAGAIVAVAGVALVQLLRMV